jgi:hypothetical protein
MIIYYYDLNNYFTQKIVFGKILLYIFKVQKIRKSTGNFLLFLKLLKFGQCAYKHEKKRKSSLEARKMKLEG